MSEFSFYQEPKSLTANDANGGRAAASSGVLPRWRPSVLSVFARRDNEPKQVIKQKCISDQTLNVPQDKRGTEEKRTKSVCESRSGSSARSVFMSLNPEIRKKTQFIPKAART